MRAGIMQPYFLPYIGYFQLINAVDQFVVYDNIQFSKKGWINRNRILVNKKDEYITLPLKKDSDFVDVFQRTLSDSFKEERNKITRKLEASYRKAPQFEIVFPLMKDILNYGDDNLFRFILHSLNIICEYLHITTPFIISSSLEIDDKLKAQDKVIAICKALNATEYVNPIGGLELYSKEIFKQNNIDLKFIKANNIVYQQLDHEFVPWLSIIDVMMFNPKETIKEYLNSFTLA